MSALDRRHRWGSPVRILAGVEYTCVRCGKVTRFEMIIPEWMAGHLVDVIQRPNPYRTMIG